MKKIKVLNLYAGIGGNRKLWKNVDVTAVEIDEKIANIYKENFPEDEVIICPDCKRVHDILRETAVICACGIKILSKEYSREKMLNYLDYDMKNDLTN